MPGEALGEAAAAAGHAGEPPPASYGAQGMAQGGGLSAQAGGAGAGGAAGAVYLSVLAGPDARTCVAYSAVEPGKLLSAWREGGGGGEGGEGGGGGGGGGGGRLCVALRRGHTCELHSVPLSLLEPSPAP